MIVHILSSHKRAIIDLAEQYRDNRYLTLIKGVRTDQNIWPIAMLNEFQQFKQFQFTHVITSFQTHQTATINKKFMQSF